MKELLINLGLNTYFSLFAGLVGVLFTGRLNKYGIFVILLIWFNIIADLIANHLANQYIESGIVYNILTPIEQCGTLALYFFYTQKSLYKKLLITAILLLLIWVFCDFVFFIGWSDFHFYSFIGGGYLVAAGSYLMLRDEIFKPRAFNHLFIWFILANLVYYTLMVSSMSSIPFAGQISVDLAASLKIINDVAYIFWSLLIAFGIIWSSKQIT